MNVERLYEIVTFLRRNDADLGMQTGLSTLNTHLSSLANQPQNQAQQTNVSSSLNDLFNAFENFERQISPAQTVLIKEINGSPYFSIQLVHQIKERLVENSITPAVVSAEVSTLTAERQTYLNKLTEVESGLQALGVEKKEPQPGDVELGVLVPRALFENHLGHLAQELTTINRIIRIFVEVSTGTGHEIEVRQISTTDPTFFLGIPILALLQIGHVTDWLTKKWKEIEEIRKLRAETKKLEIEDAVKAYDAKIEALVQANIKEMKRELIEGYKGEKGRKNELENSLDWALSSLVARIERGLTIEIRVLAPPADNADGDSDENAKVYTALETVGRSLQAVKVFGEQPILSLPAPEPPKPPKKN